MMKHIQGLAPLWGENRGAYIMLKILKAKARKNKKENNIVIGAKGTGMVRAYIKPIVSVTGEELLNSLLIRGK